MGGKCGGDQIFKSYSIFGRYYNLFLLLGNEDATDIIWYHTKSKLIYLVVEWNPTDLPHNKDPHILSRRGVRSPSLATPLFFFTESCTLWIRGCSRVARQRILSRRGARECQRDSNPYQSWTSDHHQKSKIMQLEPSWHCLSSRIRSSSRQWLVIYLLLQTDRYFIAQWSIALC